MHFSKVPFFLYESVSLKKSIFFFAGRGNVSVLISSHLTNAFALDDLLSLHLFI